MKEDKGKNEEKLQQKYMEFQMLQQQIEQVSKYMQELNSKAEEFQITKKNVEGMNQLSGSPEAMVSLAPGIFAYGEIKDTKKFVVNVGANILAEKTIPQITEMLEKQIDEINRIRSQINENLEALNKRAEEIIMELQG